MIYLNYRIKLFSLGKENVIFEDYFVTSEEVVLGHKLVVKDHKTDF